MSGLAFQTQLASIMEALANAAVAEICKLVDDDYAVVTLQMSQVQKENKALKRKLHLLELKMARGTAERRLRESQGRGGGLRVTVSGGERLRELSPPQDGPFSQSSLWPLRSIASGITEEPPQSKSPDVQFVEPEPLIVKEETKVETKEEEVHLIEDNVVMETSPLVPDRPQRGLELLPQPCPKPPPQPGRRAHGAPNRRVEDEDSDVVLVKVEEPEEPKPKSRKSPALSIQEGLVESSTDDFKSALPFAEASQLPTNQLEESPRGLSEPELLMKPPGSDLGLFELEPILCHWAPNTDSAAAPGGSAAAPGGSAAAPGGSAAAPGGERRKSEVIDVDEDSDLLINERRRKMKPQPSVSQAPPPALSSIQIHSVRSEWTPPVLLQNNPGTSQQTLAKPSSVPIAVSPINPSSSAVASSSSSGPNIYRAQSLQRPRPGLTTAAQRPGLTTVSQSRRAGRKFLCRVCGKAFPAWSNLEIHQRVHTGEKPFSCDTCGKCFSEAGNLKKHQKVHTGEKPFGCERCGKRFAWICNLKTHQQAATGCGAKRGGNIG